MKKLGSFALAALMAFALIGCTPAAEPSPAPAPAEPSDEPASQIPNPMVGVENIEAFKALGFDFLIPEGAVVNELFIISDSIADARITIGERDYTMRASMKESDISGVYESFTATAPVEVVCPRCAETVSAAVSNAATGGMLASWAHEGVNFALWCADAAADDPAFNAAVLAALSAYYPQSEQTGADGSVVAVALGESAVIDLDGDGLEDTVSIEASAHDEYDDFVALKIITGTGEELSTIVDIIGIVELSIVDIDPEDGLKDMFVSGDVCSSDFSTWFFRLVDGKLACAKEIYEPSEYPGCEFGPSVGGSFDALANGNVVISNVIDLLGTWGGHTEYALSGSGADFALEKVPSAPYIFDIAAEADADTWLYAGIVTKETFLVTMDGDSEETVIPAGTKLLPTETDYESYVRFVTEDGRTGLISIRRATEADYNSWGWFIDNIHETELFEELRYAG